MDALTPKHPDKDAALGKEAERLRHWSGAPL